MNLCIVIPSFDYLLQAGARIRYSRMRDKLEAYGIKMDFREVSELNRVGWLIHDVYIISKCYDARVVVLSKYLKDLGKVVGVDLFDDYFSQLHDSRFSRLRYWLKSLAEKCDFAMCSTVNMKSVARQYLPWQPIHVMNDPYDDFQQSSLIDSIEQKQTNLVKFKRLDVVWFGIGDNSNFEVGLKDLVGYSSALNGLRGHGYEVFLRILTNRRSLTVDAISSLNRLPVDFSVEEWTEEREKQFLESSILCFLPVNSQNFSVVKSLNRAVTCLTAGTQILSPGFHLYQCLGEYIYSSPEGFIEDLKQKKFKVRTETCGGLIATLDKYASPDNEAIDLATFLKNIESDIKTKNLSVRASNIHHALVNGIDSLGDTHKFIQKLGGFSVGSPFCSARLNFDIRIFLDNKTHTLCVAVSVKTIPYLTIPSEFISEKEHNFASRIYKTVSPEYFCDDTKTVLAQKYFFDISAQPFNVLNLYPTMMANCFKIVKELVPEASVTLSENSKLPWWIAKLESSEEVTA